MDRTSDNDVSKLAVRTACTVTSIEAYRQRVEARESCLRELRRWARAEWARQVRRLPDLEREERLRRVGGQR